MWDGFLKKIAEFLFVIILNFKFYVNIFSFFSSLVYIFFPIFLHFCCFLGLVPIVEIPYAKYLDCAADIFHEAVSTYWLSNGKQSNGMMIRLQGFDKGIFGGNYHTHNSVSIPPGIDVVCYSNGADYVQGLRWENIIIYICKVKN